MLHKQVRLALLTFSLILSFSACSSKKKHHTQPHKPPVIRYHSDGNITQTALIVAVHDYAGNTNDLNGIDIDATQMKTLLQNWDFNVTISKYPMLLEAQLVHYAQTLTQKDVFIFYYSGHGTSTPDTSHDEIDGRDELIVLSDADTNLFILDDKINLMLNKIKARKLIIFDSCNSGTALKAMANTPENPMTTQQKYIVAPKGVEDDAPQNSQVPNTPMQGTYLFFAACKDNERSLASTNGSLYTNAFKSHVSLDKSAKIILKETQETLAGKFTPQLSASKESLKLMPLSDYLKLKP